MPVPLSVDLNAEMKFPVKLKLGNSLKPESLTDGSIRLEGDQGSVDVTITKDDSGQIALMPTDEVPAGKYTVVVEPTALEPEDRPLEGPITLSFLRMVA